MSHVLCVYVSSDEVQTLQAQRGVQERNVRYVTWQQWLRLDSRERHLGQARGAPREKLVDWSELLAASSAP
jgi:hypothetical protein